MPNRPDSGRFRINPGGQLTPTTPADAAEIDERIRIENRARELAEEILRERDREAKEENTERRLADLEARVALLDPLPGQVETLAKGYQEAAESVSKVEAGQLNKKTTRKVWAIGGGGSVIAAIIAETLRQMIGG